MKTPDIDRGLWRWLVVEDVTDVARAYILQSAGRGYQWRNMERTNSETLGLESRSRDAHFFRKRLQEFLRRRKWCASPPRSCSGWRSKASATRRRVTIVIGRPA